jgi:hypothetical protein
MTDLEATTISRALSAGAIREMVVAAFSSEQCDEPGLVERALVVMSGIGKLVGDDESTRFCAPCTLLIPDGQSCWLVNQGTQVLRVMVVPRRLVIADILDVIKATHLSSDNPLNFMHPQLACESTPVDPARLNFPQVLVEALAALLDRSEGMLLQRPSGWPLRVEQLLVTATDLLGQVRQHLHASPFALSTAINMQFAIAHLSERLSAMYDRLDASLSIEQ